MPLTFTPAALGLQTGTLTANTGGSLDLSTGAGANTISNLGAVTTVGAFTLNRFLVGVFYDESG